MTGSGKSRIFRAAAFAVPVAVALSAATISAAGADDGQGPAGAGLAGASPGSPAGPAAGAGAAQQAPGTLPAQPAPVNKPGFLHQLEAWFNDGFADFNAKMKNAK